MVFRYIKRWIARYDAWCQRMGLTPENKRSCVPYRKDPLHERSTAQDD